MERFLQFSLKPRAMLPVFFLIALSFIYIDRPIALFCNETNFKVIWPWLIWITHLGLGEIYFSVFIFIALFFRYVMINPRKEACAWFLLVCVAIPDFICLGLKIIFGRARPELLFSSDLYGFFGWNFTGPYWSFPSGHTTTIFGLVFGLCVVLPRYRIPFLLVGLSVASTRILLTNHYLSDVMMGTYLTLIEVATFLFILQRNSWLVPAWSKQYNQ